MGHAQPAPGPRFSSRGRYEPRPQVRVLDDLARQPAICVVASTGTDTSRPVCGASPSGNRPSSVRPPRYATSPCWVHRPRCSCRGFDRRPDRYHGVGFGRVVAKPHSPFLGDDGAGKHSGVRRTSHLGVAHRSFMGNAALRTAARDNDRTRAGRDDGRKLAGRVPAALDAWSPRSHIGGRVSELSASPSGCAAAHRRPRSDRNSRQRARRSRSGDATPQNRRGTGRGHPTEEHRRVHRRCLSGARDRPANGKGHLRSPQRRVDPAAISRARCADRRGGVRQALRDIARHPARSSSR